MRRVPPIKLEHRRSGKCLAVFNVRLARCGLTRPMKPMSPPIETPRAVRSVEIKISRTLSLWGEYPNDRARASPKLKASNASDLNSSRTNPTKINGPKK